MADSYSAVSPLMVRHLIGSAIHYSDPNNDTVSVPHGYTEFFNKIIKKAGFDGPFPEIISRLKPLLEKYPKKRFHGVIPEIEPDGNDDIANNTDNTVNGEDPNSVPKDDSVSNSAIDGDSGSDDTVKTWYWVSAVPYRIFETFCAQHIHDWWYRYNLTRSVLEFVSFQPNGDVGALVPVRAISPENLTNIEAWERPAN